MNYLMIVKASPESFISREVCGCVSWQLPLLFFGGKGNLEAVSAEVRSPTRRAGLGLLARQWLSAEEQSPKPARRCAVPRREWGAEVMGDRNSSFFPSLLFKRRM